jgi:hypothetical protein
MSRMERRIAVALAVAASIAVGGCIGTRIGGPGARATTAPVAASHVPDASSPSASPAAPASEPAPSASDDTTGTAGPGCGTGEKGFTAHTDEVQHTLTLDGVPIELTTASISMRDGSYDADDAIPPYVGLTSDEVPVEDVPAGKLVLAAKGMALTGLTVTTRPWSSMDFSADPPSTTAKPRALTWRFVSNGRILIVAPTRVGNYVLDMTVLWQTECLHGDGTAYARVNIR